MLRVETEISFFVRKHKPAEQHSNRSGERAGGCRETLRLLCFTASYHSYRKASKNFKPPFKSYFLWLTSLKPFSTINLPHQHPPGLTVCRDKASALAADSMTEYHALCRSTDVHHRSSAREWAHRHTLAQTGCRDTDGTLFWLSEALGCSPETHTERRSDEDTSTRRQMMLMVGKHCHLSDRFRSADFCPNLLFFP